MDVANITTLISICYNAPTISPSVISFMEWAYYYLLVLGFVCVGAAFALPPIMTFISIIVQTFLVYTLWAIMEMVQDPRPPEILTNSNCHRAILFYDALNVYALPDSIMVPIFTYLAVYVYMFTRIERPGAAWFFGIVLGISFTAFTVFEFVLGRLYVYQYFVNLAITVLLAVAICGLLHAFYDLDTDEQMRLLLRSMLGTLFSTDRKIVIQWTTTMVNKKRKALKRLKKTSGLQPPDDDSDIEHLELGEDYNDYELEAIRGDRHKEGNSTHYIATSSHWSLGVEGRTLREARALRTTALKDFGNLIQKLDRNADRENNTLSHTEQWIRWVYR